MNRGTYRGQAGHKAALFALRQQHSSATPPSTLGNEGDWLLDTYGTDDAVSQSLAVTELLGPKTAGRWPTRFAGSGTQGLRYQVPHRTLSLTSVGLTPGWQVSVGNWSGTSLPADMSSYGCVGYSSGYYHKPAVVSNKALTSNVATLTVPTGHGLRVGNPITVAGVDATFNGTFTVTAVTTTTVSYAKTAADVATVAASGTVDATWYGICYAKSGFHLSQFSMTAKVSVLPEAGKVMYLGALSIVPTEGAVWGWGVGIDSGGVVTLNRFDSAAMGGGAPTVLATGPTIAANASLVFERYGFRMSVYAPASGVRSLSAPTEAWIDLSQTYDGFSNTAAGGSFGFASDSATGRLLNVRVMA